MKNERLKTGYRITECCQNCRHQTTATFGGVADEPCCGFWEKKLKQIPQHKELLRLNKFKTDLPYISAEGHCFVDDAGICPFWKERRKRTWFILRSKT